MYGYTIMRINMVKYFNIWGIPPFITISVGCTHLSYGFFLFFFFQIFFYFQPLLLVFRFLYKTTTFQP